MAYELRRRSDFLNDLVNGITSVDERATALAGTLGIDLSRPLFCCLIYIAGSSGDGPKGDINHNLEMLRLKIIDGLSGEPDCTVWDCHDYIGVLYPLPEAAADERPANGMKTARRLRQKICGYAPEVAVILGVGGMQTGPKSLLKSFRQAWGAVISARSHSKGSAGIYHYRDLGINQLLAGCGGKEHAREFVEEQIGRLIVYDRQKGTDLLGTLEEILQSANLKEVAEKMFLHHKTIVSRKQRIEKILGIAIDQFEARLAIAAAIKLYRLNRVLQ